tara:strand:- start:55 stop:888 length:834 start_codon:yes stop_codon:yes gene_type:complete
MGINTINGQTLPVSTTPLTTLSPTVSINSANPVFGVVTVTISNHSSYTNPNYSVVSKLSDGTVMVAETDVDRTLESDASHLAGTLKFVDSNASTAQRTIHVRANEFADSIQSDVVGATYTPAGAQNQYLRIRGVTSDGSDTSNRIAIDDINFYTGSGQSGTVYPTTNLTSNTSETGIVVSQGHLFSSTYAAFKAVDSSSTTFAWLLATNAANNYWEIEFETGTYSSAPVIKSIDIKFNAQNDATHFAVTGSDSADHSSATVYGVFEISAEATVLNFG